MCIIVIGDEQRKREPTREKRDRKQRRTETQENIRRHEKRDRHEKREMESEGATTFKTLPCVLSKRSRVHLQNAPVCTFETFVAQTEHSSSSEKSGKTEEVASLLQPAHDLVCHLLFDRRDCHS